MSFPINPVHRLLLEDNSSYLLLEDNSSKLILDESTALDDPLNAGTVSSVTPGLTFVGSNIMNPDLSFSDNFDSNAISGSWSTSGAADASQVKVQNKQLEITHSGATQYNSLQTSATYNLTGQAVSVQIADFGNTSQSSHQAILGIALDASNALWWATAGNQLQAFKKVATVQTQIGSTLVLDTVNHRYWRIRESLGNIYWDTSADGKTWTTQTTTSNPFAVTALTPYLQTGCFNTEITSNLAYFDNFNISGNLTYEVEVDTVNTFDSSSGNINTYYFDGHTSITDGSSAWTNKANAFDNDFSTTFASCTTFVSNTLVGAGTTAPTVGGTITQVRAKLYTKYSTEAGVQNTGFVVVAVPSGGWTWAIVNGLTVSIEADFAGGAGAADGTGIIKNGATTLTSIDIGATQVGTATSMNFYGAQLEITSSNPLLDKTSDLNTGFVDDTTTALGEDRLLLEAGNSSFGTRDSRNLTTGGLDQIIGIKYTLTEAATISSISVYSPNSGNQIGAIYSDVSGVPTTLLVSNTTPQAVTAGQFNTIPLTPTHLAAGDYWLTAMTSASSMRAYRAGPGGNKVAYNLSTVYSGGTFPSTFPTPTYSTEDYPLYATYTADAGTNSLLLEDGTSKLAINYSYPTSDYVTYSVPAATLSNGVTYYWRARNKVSNGGAYPATWSEIRSFTVSSGVVLTKTQTAIARIATIISKTQPALARIQTLLSKTQTAIARIATILTKTQPAISRIANILTKTQGAIARIQKIVTKTQAAVGRIANNLTKTQGAVSRIANNFTKTQPAISRIANIITKTQSAIARIQKTVTKAQTAIARVANNLTKTQPSIARVANTLTKTQPAIARIQRILTKTQPAIASIATVITKTQGGISRIANNFTKTQTAISRIANSLTETQGAVARIQRLLTLTQGAVSRVANIVTKAQSAIARIANNRTLTQSAVANIQNASIVTKTQSAVSRIANIVTKTQGAVARIATILTKTQSAVARVATLRTKTQPAIARIANNKTFTQGAIARIVFILTKTQPAISRIANSFTKSQTAIARVANIVTKTQPAIARLQKVVTFTQGAVARIQRLLTKTQPAIARIAQNFTKTQPAIARVANSPTKTQTAIARVATILTKTQSAIARIQKIVTKTQSAVSRIANNFTETQGAVSRIANSLTKTQPATARIQRLLTKVQTATANIVQGSTKTQLAKARIANIITSTLPAIARIANLKTKTQPAVARIQVIAAKTQGAIARVIQVFTKTQTAVARIANSRTKTQSAIANIGSTRTKTQSAISRISNLFTKSQTAVAALVSTRTKTQTATAHIISPPRIRRVTSIAIVKPGPMSIPMTAEWLNAITIPVVIPGPLSIPVVKSGPLVIPIIKLGVTVIPIVKPGPISVNIQV